MEPGSENRVTLVVPSVTDNLFVITPLADAGMLNVTLKSP